MHTHIGKGEPQRGLAIVFFKRPLQTIFLLETLCNTVQEHTDIMYAILNLAKLNPLNCPQIVTVMQYTNNSYSLRAHLQHALCVCCYTINHVHISIAAIVTSSMFCCVCNNEQHTLRYQHENPIMVNFVWQSPRTGQVIYHGFDPHLLLL